LHNGKQQQKQAANKDGNLSGHEDFPFDAYL
jgi:hypothetical protein